MVEKQTQYITFALVIFILVAVGVVIYTNLPQDDNQGNDSKQSASPYLTVSYGTEQITYSLDELKDLDVITGYGGKRTNFPSIKGQGTYTGVVMTSLVEDIAGPISDYSITVYANEKGTIENRTFNYSVVQGNVAIYNASNASEQIDTGGVIMILSYEYNGESLDENEDGKLMVAFIDTDEEKMTPASFWWKFVESITINP